jgi:hypothetical protein
MPGGNATCTEQNIVFPDRIAERIHWAHGCVAISAMMRALEGFVMHVRGGGINENGVRRCSLCMAHYN